MERLQAIHGGMYGKECVGIVADDTSEVILDIIQAKAENEPENISEWIDALRKSHQDSMGRSAIIYWPEIAWPADNEEETDDEEDLIEADKEAARAESEIEY